MTYARLSVGLLSVLVPLAVLLSVWRPVVQRYWVDAPEPTDAQVTASYEAPPDERLREIIGYRFELQKYELDGDELLAAADNLLAGVVTLENAPVDTIQVPFDGDDLDRGHSSWQLGLASFSLAELHVDAYEASGDVKYLAAARDYISRFHDTERRMLVPAGFVWNDHALAARSGVLISFWHSYRRSAIRDDGFSRVFLQVVDQISQRLADPEQYTYATNHGVMQNLALIRLALAFPELPALKSRMQNAVQRLFDQLEYFISDEGVILEHSPGYHLLGIRLLGESFRYLTLHGVDVPEKYRKSYHGALDFARHMCRPGDSSLPNHGDTSSTESCASTRAGQFDEDGRMQPLRNIDVSTKAPDAFTLFPESGYAVWQQDHGGKPAHTSMTWAYHRGMGHKHLDELSFNVWIDGTDWLVSSGYYPYIFAGRKQAVGWKGSNAPHLENEPREASRSSRLLSHHSGPRLRFVEVERRSAERPVVNRQLIQYGTTWLALDSFARRDIRKETVWLFGPGASFVDCDDGSAVIRNANSEPARMRFFLTSTPAIRLECTTGSLDAGIGMIESNGQPLGVATIHALAGEASEFQLASMSYCASAGERCVENIRLERYESPREWEVSIEYPTDSVKMRRENSMIHVDGHEQLLTNGKSVQYSDTVTVHDFRDKYQRRLSKDYVEYRSKITLYLVLLIVIQEVLIRLFFRRSRFIPRVLQIGQYVAIFAWLHYVYFA